jgi:hypothetical protein
VHIDAARTTWVLVSPGHETVERVCDWTSLVPLWVITRWGR